MHRLFWTFCSLLIILTLISSIAGGIRFRENFMDEILDDMYEDVGEISPSIMHTLTTTTDVVEEETVSQEVVTPEKAPPAVQGVSPELGINAKVIEAFDGGVYATF